MPLSLQPITLPVPSHSLTPGVHTLAWQATSPSISAQPLSAGQGSGVTEKQLQTLRVLASAQVSASQMQGLQSPSPKQPWPLGQGVGVQALLLQVWRSLSLQRTSPSSQGPVLVVLVGVSVVVVVTALGSCVEDSVTETPVMCWVVSLPSLATSPGPLQPGSSQARTVAASSGRSIGGPWCRGRRGGTSLGAPGADRPRG